MIKNLGVESVKRNQNNPRVPIIEAGIQPLIEMTGNRQINIEGSTGILLYESDNIKINTTGPVISFFGRGLSVRCISGSSVEISGFVNKIEFIT